uniref:alpha-1,2-Mannosidase n=1 Tax=Trichuris muris TaxID=70415 RepID=A0A5S6QES3_TRIMR
MMGIERSCFVCRVFFRRRRGLMRNVLKASGLAVIVMCSLFMIYLTSSDRQTVAVSFPVASQLDSFEHIAFLKNISDNDVVLPMPAGAKNRARQRETGATPSSEQKHAFCRAVHSDVFDRLENPTEVSTKLHKLLVAYNCSKQRRDKVVEMFKFAWDGYAANAWGENEVRPVTRTPHRMSVFGNNKLGLTIVDGMDTAYLMGLKDRFEAGKKWIMENLNFASAKGSLSVFETTIRFVAGLLSCYALTKDPIFVQKAAEVADALLPAFNTSTGIPYSLIEMERKMGRSWFWVTSGSSILAEFGTLHLEFEYLSILTGNPVYFEKVNKIRQFLNKMKKFDGLYSNYVNPNTGAWGIKHVSTNALGDSFYEYLLKSWLITGKRDTLAKSMYDEAIEAIVSNLVMRSKGGLAFFGEIKSNRRTFRMDHLGCFIGGMFALHTMYDETANITYRKLAREITRTCHETYIRTATRLGPEAFSFSDETEATTKNANEKYYILRPEVLESYFYLWRATKDPMYQEWAWDAAVAIEKYCKAAAGYSGIKNVYAENPELDDVQQSFFLSETLKYLYLIFSPADELSLDKWVLNTEAHPFPVRLSDENLRIYN